MLIDQNSVKTSLTSHIQYSKNRDLTLSVHTGSAVPIRLCPYIAGYAPATPNGHIFLCFIFLLTLFPLFVPNCFELNSREDVGIFRLQEKMILVL